jgi:hypothetical protein
MGRVVEPYRRGDIGLIHTEPNADAETRHIAAPDTPRNDGRPIGAREDISRLVEKQLPCFGQLDAAFRPAKQRCLEFGLQLPDLVTQRRLRDPELQGGLPEVQ